MMVSVTTTVHPHDDCGAAVARCFGRAGKVEEIRFLPQDSAEHDYYWVFFALVLLVSGLLAR